MGKRGFTPPFVENIRLQRRAGFTLVEILVSLFILGMGIVLLFNLFPLGLQALSYSRRAGEVSYLVQQKLEELKSQRPIETGSKSGTEGNLNWQMNIQPLKLGEAIVLVRVDLNIDFVFQGKPQKQQFITYLTGD